VDARASDSGIPYTSTPTAAATSNAAVAARHAGERKTPNISATTTNGNAAANTESASEPAIGV
jgi:hypothetical protein